MILSDSTDCDPAPASAPSTQADRVSMFGSRVHLAEAYAQRLAGDGIERGLIGPGEATRLWDRHLLNSAVLTQLIPPGARVVDVGSGAGLPGIPMAIRRSDLRVDLIEPMQRRTTFLTEVVDELGLDRVRVLRGRADDREIVRSAGGSDWVVARAVAPLDRLARWCLPLLAPGGRLLALKGRSAEDEITRHRRVLASIGGEEVRVEKVTAAGLGDPVVVVSVRRRASTPARHAAGPRGRHCSGPGGAS